MIGSGSYNVIKFLSGVGYYSSIFNYFFTLMIIVGLIGFGIGMIVKLISRS